MKKLLIVILFFAVNTFVFAQKADHAISISFANGLSSMLYKPAVGTQKLSWGFQAGIDYSLVFWGDASEENSGSKSKFGFSVGAVYAQTKNKYTLPEVSQSYSTIDIDNETYLHKDYVLGYKETQNIGYINIPVMFRWEMNHIYIEAGPIMGINIYSNVKNSASLVKTSGFYEQAVEDFEKVPELGFFTIEKYVGQIRPKFGLNLAAGIEIGYVYDMSAGQIGISLFCQYGFLNLRKNEDVRNFIETTNTDEKGRRILTINSSLNSELRPNTSSTVEKINSIAAGIKIQYRFKLRHSSSKEGSAE